MSLKLVFGHASCPEQEFRSQNGTFGHRDYSKRQANHVVWILNTDHTPLQIIQQHTFPVKWHLGFTLVYLKRENPVLPEKKQKGGNMA